MGRVCELCPEGTAEVATVYCPADSCFLCTTCDEEVHSANRLARRHVRRPVVADDICDGSSINDDSEVALVPDVSKLEEDNVSDPNTSSDEILLLSLPSQAPVSFEDAAGYDFDFDGGLGSKMPALSSIDDDTLFSGAKTLGKSFYGDISWESVVPENIEHVVPDVSATPGLGFFKRDVMEFDAPLKVVSASTGCTSAVDLKSSKEKVRISVVGRPGAVIKTDDEILKKESTMSSCSQGSSIIGHKRPREEVEGDTSTESEQKTDAEKDEAERSAEQRKKRRMEALARFRSKRANRSFTKKVRYECRKQLADSRPRVKGRFVRKIEMALFRKYGALYREHLDELEDPKKIGKSGRRVAAL